MTTPRLGEVSPDCRRRLTDHYGPAVEPWLVMVPTMLSEAAVRWRLCLDSYHDAGCASVLAVARAEDGRAVVLKAWYDRSRYVHEIAALRHILAFRASCTTTPT